MATYDLLMIAILAGLTIYGYFKGMAWQVAYIASFVASAVLANKFAGQLSPQVTSVTGVAAPWNKFLAMALIYAVASFGIWMIFRVVSKMIDSVKMEGFDHQMGAILGFGRGCLWCLGVTFLLLTVLPVPNAWKQQAVNSKSGYYIARFIDKTDTLFPPEVHEVVGPYLDRLGNELEGGQGGVTPTTSGEWPGSVAQPPSQPSTPAWGQSAPAPGGGSSWPTPSPNSNPGSTWPQANSTAPTTAPADNYNWPDAADTRPATPAQPVTWPDWNR